MAPMKVLEGLPEGWSQEECATCQMVFAFPPLAEGSGINVKDKLKEELDRHVMQHHIDLPSAWKAEESNCFASVRHQGPDLEAHAHKQALKKRSTARRSSP